MTAGDPLTPNSYDSSSICDPEISEKFKIQSTGHGNLGHIRPMTLLFKRQQAKQKPLHVHVTITADNSLGLRSSLGQVGISCSVLEQIKGVKGKVLKPLDGNDDKKGLKKCKLYFSIDAELAKT